MKKTRNHRKYSWLERIAIAMCAFVSVLAVIIAISVMGTTKTIDEEEPAITEMLMAAEEVTANEVTTPAEEVNPVETVAPVPTEESNVEETIAPAPTEEIIVEETIPATEAYVPEIEDIQDNISDWCLTSESNEPVTIWKRADKEGNLLISLKNEQDEFIATFKYEGIDASNYEEWTMCNDVFEEVTISDIVDYAFTSYHEVSGRNAENVQAQIGVLINRQSSDKYPDSIREVVTDRGQYSCAKKVVSRRLKNNNYLEAQDVEKCFKQVILVLAGENIQEVPANVIFAAPFSQGSGVWKVIDGTYYCYK